LLRRYAPRNDGRGRGRVKTDLPGDLTFIRYHPPHHQFCLADFSLLRPSRHHDFVNRDELVEVTPKNIRLRKKLLTYSQRLRSVSAARFSITP